MSEQQLRSGVIFSKKERLHRQTAETAQGQENEALRLDMVKRKLSADTAGRGRAAPVCQGQGTRSQELNQTGKMQTSSASDGGGTAISGVRESRSDPSGATHNWEPQAGSLSRQVCFA